jgi:hypothetical protein
MASVQRNQRLDHGAYQMHDWNWQHPSDEQMHREHPSVLEAAGRPVQFDQRRCLRNCFGAVDNEAAQSHYMLHKGTVGSDQLTVNDICKELKAQRIHV